jgi:hypothetical protein
MKYEKRRVWGRTRYYPLDDDALAIVLLFRSNGHAQRCLTHIQYTILFMAGCKFEVTEDEADELRNGPSDKINADQLRIPAPGVRKRGRPKGNGKKS